MLQTKRDSTKSFFPLPNAIFRIGLTSGEILVYTYLMYCENRKTYQCHPSYSTIGEAVGMSNNTVKKHVDGLRKKGLITTEYTTVTTKDGRVYHFYHLQQVLQQYLFLHNNLNQSEHFPLQ